MVMCLVGITTEVSKLTDFSNSTCCHFRCSSFQFIKDYSKNFSRSSCIEIRSIGNDKIFYKDFENFFCNDYRLEKIKERFYKVYKNNIIVGYMKNNCQFFIIVKRLDFCKDFFEFLEKQLHVKTCYSINGRYYNVETQDINGGYDSVKFVNYLQFDIEEKSKTKPSKIKDEMFNQYLNHLQQLFENYGLKFKYVMNSGNGRHVLCEVQRTEVNEERRNWYNEFFKHLLMKCEDVVFKIDDVKDFTRVFGLPGTINPKWNKYIKVMYRSDTLSDLRIKRKKSKIVLNENQELVRFNTENEKEEAVMKEPLVVSLLSNRLPEGERNNKLIFPLKQFLKYVGYEENDTFVKKLFSMIAQVQGEKFSKNFPSKKSNFSKNRVNSYFVENNLKKIY